MIDAGSSPTRTAARPGGIPARATSSFTPSATSARTRAAMALPSMICAGIPTPPCRRRPRSWFLLAADRFQVVAVRVEHEGAVVLLVVLGPRPGRSVVPGARRQGSGVEGADGGAIACAEGEVGGSVRSGCLGDPEVGLAAGAEAEEGAVHDGDRIAERSQRRLVECAAAGEVAHAHGEVVDHGGAL